MSFRSVGFLLLVAVLFGVIAAPTLIAAADNGAAARFGSEPWSVTKDGGDNLAAMGLLGGMTVLALALTAKKSRPRRK